MAIRVLITLTVRAHYSDTYYCGHLQAKYLEGLRQNGLQAGEESQARPTDFHPDFVNLADISGTADDPALEASNDAMPWGEPDVVHHLLTNMGGVDGKRVNIDLERGPLEGMSYLEKQATTPIYTGSKKSRLNFIIWALGLQTRNKISNYAMDQWLRGISEHVIPMGPGIVNNMPRSRYEARKVITECGLDYVTIHSCPCDETIYYGSNENLTQCPHISCDLSRYREDTIKKDVPRKKFHYFPLAPRLVNLYRSPTFSRLMQWYYLHRSDEGLLKVPSDGAAFKHAENLFREHVGRSYDCRNVFLGLAMDGLNPRGQNSTSHSTWPVLLVLYNMPPWLSTKAAHILVSLIIPGTPLHTIVHRFG